MTAESTVSPPPLSDGDIKSQLEKHYAHERKHHLFAFFGTGDETTLEVPNAGRFFVVPVESELDLREKLASYLSDGARAAFLVPWSTEVPLDLRGRFARGGKVLRVGTAARLQRMFGVAEVSDAARKSALARYLLAHAGNETFSAESGRLTEPAMWQTWLRARFRLDAPGALALDTLLGWAATDGHGESFAEAMKSPSAAGVRDALLAFLERELGAAGPVVWRAWETGRGESALAWAVLCEDLEARSEAAQLWLRQKLKQELDIAETETAKAAAGELGRAAAGALAQWSRQTDGRARQALLTRADALVDEPTVRADLAQHRRLPSAWRARLDKLGDALSAALRDALRDGASALTREAVERASDAFGELEAHDLFPEERETHTVKRALMAVRLLAWLVARPDRRTEGQLAPHGDAVALGNWYAAEGGYVDWARGFARGSGADRFGAGVQAVVEAADEARAALDARFANGLKAWIEAKRPSSDVVPIDHALKRIAAPFLRGEDDRRLLVLLMDGMAWAQAVELLQAMGERSMAWGPLAWHASAEGRIGAAPVPTVFATLPTVTDVSRSAFFAGKALKAGETRSAAKDPERFAQHRALGELCAADAAPRLRLRAETSTASGSVAQEALTMVADPKQRVVGIVLNAIDASLKRDPQQHPRWDIDAIRPLGDLLDAAQRAGRAILLASDHGHVPTDLLARVGDSGSGGARWRPWEGERDELAEGELKLSGEGVWTPKGRDAVVLLTGDRKRYGKAPNAGEHGGAALAEVVAPCLLIGAATQDIDGDLGQRVVGAHAPEWWLLRVRDEPGREEEAREAPPKPRRAKKKPENQLELIPSPEPAPVQRAVPEPAEPDLSKHALAASKLFGSLAKTKTAQAEVLRAVDFLHARGGTASAEAFAAAMGELAFRVRGLVSKLQSVLNVDGYQVLWFDQAGKQVKLDVGKLEQQFEVKL
ncbi:MAG: BREX-2 system phosphatase PglZ [Sandaracinaceae bacterium]